MKVLPPTKGYTPKEIKQKLTVNGKSKHKFVKDIKEILKKSGFDDIGKNQIITFHEKGYDPEKIMNEIKEDGKPKYELDEISDYINEIQKRREAKKGRKNQER